MYLQVFYCMKDIQKASASHVFTCIAFIAAAWCYLHAYVDSGTWHVYGRVKYIS